MNFLKEFYQVLPNTANSWFTAFTNAVSLFAVYCDLDYFVLFKSLRVVESLLSVDDLKWLNGFMLACWAAWGTANKLNAGAVGASPMVEPK